MVSKGDTRCVDYGSDKRASSPAGKPLIRTSAV